MTIQQTIDKTIEKLREYEEYPLLLGIIYIIFGIIGLFLPIIPGFLLLGIGIWYIRKWRKNEKM